MAGIPYLTLDPATGRSVALMPDGSVVPLAMRPGVLPVGGFADAGRGTPGSGGAGVPLDLTAAPFGGGVTGLSGGYRPTGSRGGFSDPTASFGSNGIDRASGGLGTAGSLGAAGADGGIPRPDGLYGPQTGGGGGLRPPESGAGGADFGSYGGPDYGQHRGADGGAAGSAADRLAAARGRLQGARYELRDRLASAGLGGGGGGSSGYGGQTGYESGYGDQEKRVKEERMRGRYAHGLDPSQALGLTLRPTAMLPRVWPGLTPAAPLYTTLAEMPAGAWAQI